MDQHFELSESEARDIAKWDLDNLPWPYIIVSVPDYRCLYLNDAADNVFRFMPNTTKNDFIGKQASEVLPKWTETFLPAYEEVRLSGKLQQFHHIEYRRHKRKTYWDVTLTPTHDASGEVSTISCIAVESTKPRRITRERERLASILEATTDFVITSDLAGHVLYLNRAAREIFGIAPDSKLGGMSLSKCHPDWAYQLSREESIPIAIKNGILSGETSILDHNGGQIPVSQVIITHRSSDGKVDYFSMIARDITERKLAEKRHEEMEAHKLAFYRRTILAATEGKLMITEREEVAAIAGKPTLTWEIRQAEDLGSVRYKIRDLALTDGMEEARIHNFALACGEGLTNAIVHAHGGVASLHRLPNALLLMITDQGPGIEALNLPDVALTPGYSTAGTLGMGYKAMISFADKVYLATSPTGTTLAIEMKLVPDDTNLRLNFNLVF